jgi:hypothetical protein
MIPFKGILREVIAKINLPLFFFIFTEISPYFGAEKVPHLRKKHTSMRAPGSLERGRWCLGAQYVKL